MSTNHNGMFQAPTTSPAATAAATGNSTNGRSPDSTSSTSMPSTPSPPARRELLAPAALAASVRELLGAGDGAVGSPGLPLSFIGEDSSSEQLAASIRRKFSATPSDESPAADKASSPFIPSRDHVANHTPSLPTNRKRTRSPGGSASPPAHRDARTAAATAAAAEAKPDLLVELLIAAAAKEQVRMEQHIKIEKESRCPYGRPYYMKRTVGACGWDCGECTDAYMQELKEKALTQEHFAKKWRAAAAKEAVANGTHLDGTHKPLRLRGAGPQGTPPPTPTNEEDEEGTVCA